MDVTKRTLTVDRETGEIIKEQEKDYYSRVWKDGKGAMIKIRNNHNKFYHDIKLSNVIKDRQDFMRVHLLAENIYKDTNIIYIREGKNFRIADLEDISSVLELRIRSTKEFLDRMRIIGVIAELTLRIKDTVQISYVFNPMFINSSKFISNELYLLFKNHIDTSLPQWLKDKYKEMNNSYNKKLK